MEVKLEEIIATLIKDSVNAVADKFYKVGTSQYKKLLVILEFCFSQYLDRTYERCKKIKTLLYRDRPVDLKAHYVSTDFQLDKEIICGSDIFDSFKGNKKCIVTGTAGSGKSVLLRHLFVDLIDNPKDFIPILVELRLLITPEGDYSILGFVHKALSDLNNDFTEEQLSYALKEGKIALFLDGFDEIDFSQKDKYEREILDISNKYSNSIIIVSSRPDDCFSSWDEFHIYKAQPLNQQQSIDLISRIEYDKTVKNKFIAELKEGLYEKHRDFLSNPLLLTMMLLTYEQLAEIPEKIHIFYEQAFDTLYHKHDALKSLYKRKSYCGLPIDDFKKIFAAFCIITYSERKMSFSFDEIISYLDKAIAVEGFEIKSRSFFNDLVKSVCIIQKDGTIYTFSHRSFQEYFAAYYLSISQTIDTGRALDKVVENHHRDNLIDILFELNKEKVETKWVIPRLETILEQCPPEGSKDIISFLSVFYNGFSFQHEPHFSFLYKDDQCSGHFLQWLLWRGYTEESDLFFPLVEENHEAREERINKEFNYMEKKLLPCINEKREAKFSNFPKDIEFLNESLIPKYCDSVYSFLQIVHKKLKAKYFKRTESLSALLFK